MKNLKTENLKVPLAINENIFNMKMYDKKIKNSNKDESDSDEYDNDMDVENEILV